MRTRAMAVPSSRSDSYAFLAGVGWLLVFTLLWYINDAREEAIKRAADAPWELLIEVEDCGIPEHGAEHSPAEIEAHIRVMEERAREDAEFEHHAADSYPRN